MPILDRQSLAKQARMTFRAYGYDRKGGKGNRADQLNRACTVCDWVQSNHQVKRLEQMGGKHVIKFWKAHQNLTPQTRYYYWLALCKLWEFTGRAGKPPMPKEALRALE